MRVPMLLRRGGLVALALALPGCALFREIGLGGDDAKWQEKSYLGVHPSDMLRLVRTVLEEHDRYPIRREDLYRGELESGWVYGYFDDLSHKSKRERVLVETEEQKDDHVKLKLRVQCQLNADPGRQLARNEGDWESAADDVERAKIEMRRIDIVLQKIATPEPTAPAPEPATDARVKG